MSTKGGTKGSIKTPGSGRKKGTPNKEVVPLLEKCAELNCDPFEILLLFAKGDWRALGYPSPERVKTVTESGFEITEDIISADLRASSAKEACQYIHPKRKAIEHSNADAEGFRVVIEDYTSAKKEKSK